MLKTTPRQYNELAMEDGLFVGREISKAVHACWMASSMSPNQFKVPLIVP